MRKMYMRDYGMIQEIISFLFSVIQSVVIFGIVGSVLQSRFTKCVKILGLSVSILIGAIGINVIGDSYIQGIIWLILIGILCQILYRGPVAVKVFYVLFAQYICVASEMILSTIMISLPGSLVKTITNNMFMVTGISIFIKAIVIISGVLFVGYIRKINPNLQRRYWIGMDLFLLTIIESVQLLFALSLSMQKTEFYFYTMVLLYALLLLGIFVIYFLGKICWIYEKNTEYELWQMKGNELQNVITYQSEVNEEMKKTRHDMKKHLGNILYMIENDQTEKAKEYIGKLTDAILATKQNVYTGNYIIDAILNKHMVLCKSKNVKLELSVDEIPKLDTNPVDISAILDNLLDNAIEAVEKPEIIKRCIEVKLFLYKNNFAVVVKNPYDAKLQINEKYISTSKSEQMEHGYGLKSVESAVERNGGVFNYYAEESEFTAVVMLPINLI